MNVTSVSFMSVEQSGIGNYMIVEINGGAYKSSISAEEEYTNQIMQDQVKEVLDSLSEKIHEDDRAFIENKFEQYLTDLENSRLEDLAITEELAIEPAEYTDYETV